MANPKFTARHYNTIAGALAERHATLQKFQATAYSVANAGRLSEVEYIADMFARGFAIDNPKFDRALFLAVVERWHAKFSTRRMQSTPYLSA